MTSGSEKASARLATPLFQTQPSGLPFIAHKKIGFPASRACRRAAHRSTSQGICVQRSSSIMDLEQIQEGTGSGFIWDDAGHVVTNFHVVGGADACQVALPADHLTYNATVVGAYPDKDIDVL